MHEESVNSFIAFNLIPAQHVVSEILTFNWFDMVSVD